MRTVTIGDKDPNRTRQDPRGPEHWKQVVESARMFETMMQEVLQDWAIHAITKLLNSAKGFVVESRL